MGAMNWIMWSLLGLYLVINAVHAGPSKGPDALILACGSDNGGKDSDGRLWQSDNKYLVSGDKSVVAKAETQDPSLFSDVPYMIARIFTSETSYKLPLQNDTSRTLLRLYFYPSSYPSYNISTSYFNVTAGGVTLLSNFSANLVAQALSQAYIIKEYYLAPTKIPALHLTFKPADKSFAFVNGIEVISTPPLFDKDPELVGASQAPNDYGGDQDTTMTLPIDTSSMETMFRLNVGGQFIGPTNDSGGLMRSWYDDSPYVFGAGVGITMTANATIKYKDLPQYTAPLDVYASYRSMGESADVNRGYNLTWIFQVDPNFMYLLRFHWCDSEMTKANQRVFNIFINNQTATSEVDIFSWTNAIATPMKKDYAVYVKGGNDGNDTMLWLALHPSESVKPEYLDALLNGLEVFKLSDSKANLAGPNPMVSDMMKKYQESHVAPQNPAENKPSKTPVIISGAAGGAAALGVAAVVFIIAYRKKNKVPGTGSDGTTTSSWLPISWTHSSATKSTISGRSQGGTAISSDAAANCRYFSLAEIQTATKNFDEYNVIGVGGFGKVYKGVIDGGTTKVAIKRSNPSSEQGVNEFQTEIEMLSKLRHRHLVSLIGFCEDNGEMILVYDYMGNGTLREHLYKGNKINLTWKQRLEICIGAARGLHYLHTGAKYTIIHRDVKTTNILLDEKWVAKVSDFGLSKTGPNMNNKGHVSTVVKGSFGYLDPEYFRRQQLTEKSDVYSFGVVLFEVLCGRPALNPSLPKEQVSLADWALRCIRNKTLHEIIDPHLKGQISPQCLKKFADTAEKCLSDHGTDRPSMGNVLWNLEFALQLLDNGATDEAVVEGVGLGNGGGEVEEAVDHKALMAMHRNTLSLGSETDPLDQPMEENTNDIFSQIVNPTGR